MDKFGRPALRVLVHVAILFPLVLLAWQYSQGLLTANPIEELTRRTGRYTLILIVVALACTPAYIVSGIRGVLALRRTTGLYVFFYDVLHFFTFIGLDYRFNLGLLRADLPEKRYIFVGLAALIILLPLAVTSSEGWLRRLGKNWGRLQQSFYLVAVLSVVHFALQVKVDYRLPLLYGLIVALLLAIRLPPVTSAIIELRARLLRKG